MKKLLLSLLLCSSLLSFAQDWNPFPLGQKSYYSNASSNNATINIIQFDSLANINGQQTIYFNYTDTNYHGCYENVFRAFNSMNQYNNYVYYFRPDSIIKSNDSLTLKYSDDSLLFIPNISLNQFWYSEIHNSSNYNILKFTCDSMFLDTIVGSIIDSVKLFKIKAYDNTTPINSKFDTLPIILSKNYGFKQIPSFDSYNNVNNTIIGLSNSTFQDGFIEPSFEDYFHLNIGDVIIWKENFDTYDFINNPSYTKYYKDSLINSSLSLDSVFYNFQRVYNDGTTYFVNSTYYKKRFNGLHLGTSVYITGNNASNYYPYESLISTSPIFSTYDTLLTRQFGFDGLMFDTSNCYTNVMMDVWSGESYNTKYGLSQYFNGGTGGLMNWDIIGSTINGIQEGVLWSTLVTGVDNFENTSNVKIYPNPSQSGNFVVESEQVKSVELLSIDGKTVFTQTINQSKTEIKTGLPKGLYFVKLTFENKKQVIQKLIITQ